jgi:hypothetical protein
MQSHWPEWKRGPLVGFARTRPIERECRSTTRSYEIWRWEQDTLTVGISCGSGVPGTAGRSAGNRAWVPDGASISNFGSDTLCPATRMPDPCPPVVHKRRRLRMDKHNGQASRARPVQGPGASKSLQVGGVRGLNQRVYRPLHMRWPGSLGGAGCHLISFQLRKSQSHNLSFLPGPTQDRNMS